MGVLDRSRKAAADWVVRLSAADTAEPDWLAFERWLDASPHNRHAYDECMALWLALGDVADTLSDNDLDAVGRPLQRPSPALASPSVWWAGGAAAALALIAVSSSLYLRPDDRAAPATVYATELGKQSTVQLADGTRIDLGGASRIAVRFDAGHRDVTLMNGEAAFKVTHDAERPFTVAVGDRRVEDVGTEFDVRRGPADIAVTVREGLVQVGPVAGADGAVISVRPGQRLRHADGADASVVERVMADDIFAWRSGRLIYRDQPLQIVAEDLNRYLPNPLSLQGDTIAKLRFTGVLNVDSEAPTLSRLQALLPVSATPSNGAIILSSRENAR